MTARGALPYPLGSDPPDTDGVVRALAQRLGLVVLFRERGLAADRGGATAAREGTLWYSTDTGAVDYCTGTAWIALVQPPLDYGEAADVSASAPGDTAAAGATGEVADAGHRHPREAYGTSAQLVASAPGDTAAAGTAAPVARIDHRHPRETPAPSTVGYARLFLSRGA